MKKYYALYYTLLMLSSLVYLLFFAYGVAAEKPADVNIFMGECSDDGSVNFTARNYYHEELFLKDVEVKLISPNREIIPLKGVWDKEYIRGDYCYDENPIQYSAFSSERGIANISGIYKVALTYLKCEKTPCETCEEEYPLGYCPGYSYDCSISNPKIRCFNKKGAVHILFSGINSGQFTKIDPDKDLYFELEGIEADLKKFSYSNFNAENFDRPVKDYKNDSYYLIIPMDKGRVVEKATLRLKPCTINPLVKFEAKCEYDSEEDVKAADNAAAQQPSSIITGDLMADIIEPALKDDQYNGEKRPKFSDQAVIALVCLAAGFVLGFAIKINRVIRRK